jgi:hypothetical protein
MEEASDLCLSYGGSLSGEHGDGQAKGELRKKMFGPELIEAFREFKTIWDPDWRMNPGKVINPYPLDSTLRLGPDYRPKPVETWFKFPHDNGSFAHAAERCFGIGKCRSLGGNARYCQAQLRETMHAMRPSLDRGLPIIVLEPSCASVFRDELLNLFPNDADALRLSRQCLLLGEFLARDPHYRPPRLSRRALMHAHCHHKAIMGTDADTGLLRWMGLELDCPETGCCGLAGSFGYERERYEVSMRIGEHVLLPAVREASKETLIIADGFSCRSPIEHGTARRALHLAEVLQMALGGDSPGMRPVYPEPAFAQPAAEITTAGAVAGVLIGTAALMLAVSVVRSRRSGRVASN